MTLTDFRVRLRSEQHLFTDTLAYIAEHYSYSPSAFTNGSVENPPGRTRAPARPWLRHSRRPEPGREPAGVRRALPRRARAPRRHRSRQYPRPPGDWTGRRQLRAPAAVAPRLRLLARCKSPADAGLFLGRSKCPTARNPVVGASLLTKLQSIAPSGPRASTLREKRPLARQKKAPQSGASSCTPALRAVTGNPGSARRPARPCSRRRRT